MTHLDQAISRAFRKIYREFWLSKLKAASRRGSLTPREHKAVMIAWDRLRENER